jgi:hypothetical protein
MCQEVSENPIAERAALAFLFTNPKKYAIMNANSRSSQFFCGAAWSTDPKGV